ncbi:thiamine phosphate synthase [Nocardioides sp. NPDC058538]|uniref:thiamine phosphate synthase n=1 Tax=Nocardioides sp. NPDC058538 TaxID=3346542 RepID=UPI0036564F89
MTGLPRLLVLTDRSQLPLGRSLVATMAACAEAGLTHVVLRELDEPLEHRAKLAELLAGLGLNVIAAHTPLPAAVGLHLPASASCNTSFVGLLALSERPDRPTNSVLHLGRSCHSPTDVATAAEEGFDYAMLSPYALTESKPGYGPPLGPEAFAGLPLPTYALGGITPANAAAAVAAGAHGVAVMGAVMRAEEPAAVVRDLLAVLATTGVAR